MVGAIAGQLAARRLPGTLVPWAASGALAGALVGLLYVGAGYLACGLRLPRWVATVIAALLLAWAVADLAGPVPSPFAAIGHLAIWPLQKEWLAVLAIPVVIGLVVLGLSLLNRLSLESAERRTALVGQLRFAATVRDLRTVMVLRRQLVQEQHRTRPWFRLPRFPRQTIWRRDLHGILRFPVVRLLRMAALTAIAAGCLNIAYHDTAPAAVLAGLALYLVGLDAIEPLAQEIDQADRADSIPKERGVLLVRHLPASALLLFLYADLRRCGRRTPSTAPAPRSPSSPSSRCRSMWAAGAGAVISVAGEEPEPGPSDTNQMLPPEVAGMRIMFRTVWPVVVCILGTAAGARRPQRGVPRPGPARRRDPGQHGRRRRRRPDRGLAPLPRAGEGVVEVDVEGEPAGAGPPRPRPGAHDERAQRANGPSGRERQQRMSGSASERMARAAESGER